jgi:hypothetical protein
MDTRVKEASDSVQVKELGSGTWKIQDAFALARQFLVCVF